ncbi:hypothetical protein [Evansella tamaricis]|uniref:Uncharacterized protein n=1 Tax=Evansella tamaricis TaxID=2069301 RepID=A0ABS6JGP0_9BACI|nr:hypothetical protein [Evansella tamaricis]MBU9712389.1 hypothetical protein [Evansella tamaricis]
MKRKFLKGIGIGVGIGLAIYVSGMLKEYKEREEVARERATFGTGQ